MKDGAQYLEGIEQGNSPGRSPTTGKTHSGGPSVIHEVWLDHFCDGLIHLGVPGGR